MARHRPARVTSPWPTPLLPRRQAPTGVAASQYAQLTPRSAHTEEHALPKQDAADGDVLGAADLELLPRRVDAASPATDTFVCSSTTSPSPVVADHPAATAPALVPDAVAVEGHVTDAAARLAADAAALAAAAAKASGRLEPLEAATTAAVYSPSSCRAVSHHHHPAPPSELLDSLGVSSCPSPTRPVSPARHESQPSTLRVARGWGGAGRHEMGGEPPLGGICPLRQDVGASGDAGADGGEVGAETAAAAAVPALRRPVSQPARLSVGLAPLIGVAVVAPPVPGAVLPPSSSVPALHKVPRSPRPPAPDATTFSTCGGVVHKFTCGSDPAGCRAHQVQPPVTCSCGQNSGEARAARCRGNSPEHGSAHGHAQARLRSGGSARLDTPHGRLRQLAPLSLGAKGAAPALPAAATSTGSRSKAVRSLDASIW